MNKIEKKKVNIYSQNSRKLPNLRILPPSSTHVLSQENARLGPGAIYLDPSKVPPYSNINTKYKP